MIKVQALGHRSAGLSHAEAIAHHRNIHSKLGIAQGGHMGGYILYYFEEALGADGSPLPDFPWDMSALEWFREDKYWDDFQKWLETAPDGLEVKHDEASFLDRDKCYLSPYEERIVTDSHSGGDVINLLRLLTFKPGADAGRHAGSIAAIQAHFGAALRKLTVNSISYSTRLSSGRIPQKALDVVEIYKFDRAAFANHAELVRNFAAPAIAQAEAAIFAPEKTANMIAEEVVFQPQDRKALELQHS